MTTLPPNFTTKVNQYFPFDNDHLKGIFTLFSKRELKKGTEVVKINEVSKELIFIERGILREYYLEDGQEQTTWVLNEGFFTLSLASFIDQKPSKYAIECVTPCVLYTLNKSTYESLLSSNPQVLLFNNALLMEYLRVYDQRMELLRVRDGYSRFKLFMQAESAVARNITDKLIASYLNIDKTSISRFRRKLRDGT